MPRTIVEEQEGRIAYEATLRNIMDSVVNYIQEGVFIKAYFSIRSLYIHLHDRQRKAWLDMIEIKHSNRDCIPSRYQAKRMLDTNRPRGYNINPNSKHKWWMDIYKCWIDTAYQLELFYYSREIEKGVE